MMTCNKILEVYCKINSDYDMESNSLDENYQKYTKKIDIYNSLFNKSIFILDSTVIN